MPITFAKKADTVLGQITTIHKCATYCCQWLSTRILFEIYNVVYKALRHECAAALLLMSAKDVLHSKSCPKVVQGAKIETL